MGSAMENFARSPTTLQHYLLIIYFIKKNPHIFGNVPILWELIHGKSFSGKRYFKYFQRLCSLTEVVVRAVHSILVPFTSWHMVGCTWPSIWRYHHVTWFDQWNVSRSLKTQDASPSYLFPVMATSHVPASVWPRAQCEGDNGVE